MNNTRMRRCSVRRTVGVVANEVARPGDHPVEVDVASFLEAGVHRVARELGERENHAAHEARGRRCGAAERRELVALIDQPHDLRLDLLDGVRGDELVEARDQTCLPAPRATRRGPPRFAH